MRTLIYVLPVMALVTLAALVASVGPGEYEVAGAPGGVGQGTTLAQGSALPQATVTLLDQVVYVPLVIRGADTDPPQNPAPGVPTATPVSGVPSATPGVPTATQTATPSPTSTSTPPTGVGIYKAEVVQQSYPAQMRPGEQARAYVELKNTGTATWSNSGANPVKLGTSHPSGRISAFYTADDWEDLRTPTRLDQYRVEPGQTGRFTFVLTAPSLPGEAFSEYFAPLAEGLGGFGDMDIYFGIYVLSPTPTPTPTSTPGPAPTGTPTTPTPVPGLTPTPTPYLPPFGIQTYDSIDLDHGRKQIQDMGVKWVRIPIAWGDIEPRNTDPSGYQWSKYDSIYRDAAAIGARVIATITDSPIWAATYANGPIDKVGMGEYVQFVKALVNRYKDPPYNVKHWELFNEPDNTWPDYASRGIAYWGNDPGGFVLFMARAYGAIKEVDPQAQVALGGLAMDWFTDEGGPFARDFLDQVLAKGGSQYFDIVSFHYYPVFRWRWNPYGRDIIGKATFIRQVLAKYSVQKPLLASEVGMWSDDRMGCNEEVQAQYVPQIFSRGMAAGLVDMVWFTLQDSLEWEAKHGLLNPDLSPKPAYFAYQTMTAQLQGMRYEKPLAFSAEGAWDLEGFSFAHPSGRRISVLWTTSGTSKSLVISGQEVRRVDLYGAESNHLDGEDGTLDGRVSVKVGAGPVYLEVLR